MIRDLNLEGLGVKTDRGRILVDHNFKTNVDGIFAIGDCIPGPMLAHKAEDDGVAAAEYLVGMFIKFYFSCLFLYFIYSFIYLYLIYYRKVIFKSNRLILLEVTSAELNSFY